MKRHIPLIFGLFVFCITGLCQNIEPPNIDLSYLEEFLDGEEEVDDAVVEDLLNNLRYYTQYPLDINKASYDEYKELYILNDLQIQQILHHRLQYGDFLSIHELQTIPSISTSTVRKLAQLITVDAAVNESKPAWNWLTVGDNVLYLRWTRTLETQKGYIADSNGKTAFLGDPNKLYLRFRHEYLKKMSYGVTLEKDAGERLYSKENPAGIDYGSFHFAIRDIGKIKDLVIGDYSLNLGQGLLVSTRFSSGKSSYVMDLKRGGRIIHPYTALNEYTYFRGAAISLDLAPTLSLSMWGSSRKLDGSVFTDSDSQEQVRSLSISGLHRTPGELDRRGNLRQDLVGGQFKFQGRQLAIGINGLYYAMDKPLISSDQLYNIFDINSDKLKLASIDYSFSLRNLLFFGELGSNNFRHAGQTHGVLMSLYRFADFSLVYRHLSPGFQTFHGNIFSESGNNESGLYSGLLLRFSEEFYLSTYLDLFRFPWLRFRIDRPSIGQDFLSRLTYYKKRKLEMYLQFKYESKARNNTNVSEVITPVLNYQKRNVRLHGEYKLNRSFTYRGRIELVQFDYADNAEKGLMIYQDILYRPIGRSLSGNARIAYFNTDGFDSRIYTYENDLINNYSIPFLYLKGLRYYTNLRYRFRTITLEARLARIYFQDAVSVGSGNFEIEGKNKTDFKFQIKLNW